MDYFLYFEYHTVKFAPKHPHFSSPRVLFSSRSSNSLLARLVGVFLVFCFIDSLIKQSWDLSHTLILLLLGFSQYHVAVIAFADLFFPLQKELSCIIGNVFSELLFYQFE